MAALIHRLLKSAVAYQASSIVASLLALLTIPLYTAYLPEGAYGYAEAILTAIILASILLRFGVGEAFVRLWFDSSDESDRIRLAHSATGWTLVMSTFVVLVCLVFAEPISQLLLNTSDATLIACGLVGLWAFTNLEIAYSLLRVQELRRVYVAASLSNVLLTVAMTVTFVVVLDWGARGYVLGNYLASTMILFVLWWHQRRYLGLVPRNVRPLLSYGAPTVPADAAIFALNVVDRSYLLHTTDPIQADRFALAAKLSTVVIVAVRGFQSAWPPLAYSVDDHEEAQQLYARVTTWYVAVTGVLVAGVALVGPWAVRLLASDERFYGATEALPWVALGWGLYGLVLVLITVGGRAKVTTRNAPAAISGLAANGLLLVLLVEPLGIAGAGIALCGGYLVILVVLYLLTRELFSVPFAWSAMGRAVLLSATVAAAGVLLVPDTGAGNLAIRFALGLSLPALLLAAGVVRAGEVRALLQRRSAAVVVPSDFA
jgi:O-antigen/teichoic acid export membrane protein